MKELQKIEYSEMWCAYQSVSDRECDFVEEFDTKKQAKQYLEEQGWYGKVLCCLCVGYDGGASEYAYGKTKAEAYKQLCQLTKEYGYKPYDPFKE